MDFSEFFKLSNHLCKISPDGKRFAHSVKSKMTIRDAGSFRLARICHLECDIQHIDWSPDSKLILCANWEKHRLRVWHLEDRLWTCDVGEGSMGLVNIRWCPDSRHILTTSGLYEQITVWSLFAKRICYIKHPKKCTSYIDFTHDEKYAVVAKRKDGKDFISIINCISWTTTCHFASATEDLRGISCSPTRNFLCVWESCSKYKVLLYTMEGKCLSTIEVPDSTLGVKSVKWSPCGQVLAVGSCNGKLNIHNYMTWTLVGELDHNNVPEVPTLNVRVYKEVVEEGSLAGSSHQSTVSSQVTSLLASKPEIGIGKIVFSYNSQFVASVNDSMPSTVWIYELNTMKCNAVVILAHPIKDLSWDPKRIRLALCTGTSRVFLCTLKGVWSIPVPCKDGESFSVVRVQWWPLDGTRLAVIGQDHMCWCSTPPRLIVCVRIAK